MSRYTKHVLAVWQGGLQFEARANSNIPVRMDGDAKAGISPMEMVLMGLAGCAGGDIIDILRKKRQAVSGFEVKVIGQRATEHPRKYTDIEIVYVITGQHIDPAAVERAIELTEDKYCSVSATLQGVATIKSRYEIREAEHEAERVSAVSA
jgi:putative redox protein